MRAYRGCCFPNGVKKAELTPANGTPPPLVLTIVVVLVRSIPLKETVNPETPINPANG
jgi:hypothetical protein